ncbi:hypothetical protein B0H14DRAFT_3491457 [Mycena olivaceomarginata]|nr:hypothetical protein B0H14DRAFT_3491457 [Mycena olivaceomarginata]
MTLWLPLPLRSPCAPTPPAPRPPSRSATHARATPALPLRTRHVTTVPPVTSTPARYTLPAPSTPCPPHPVPTSSPHRLSAPTATQTCTHTAASHPRMDRSSLSPLYTGLLRTAPSLHFGAALGPPTSTMSTPPPTPVHPARLDVGACAPPRQQAAPVIRRLRMHAARLSTPVRSLQDPSSTVRPRVRQSSACTSTNYRLHSRPCRPLRATAFSPIPCSSSLSFTPSSSPSTSPIPEREPCASIVQQRRVNIRLMRRLPAACAASPAALIVSPPVRKPYRAIHSSHTPILGVPTRPFSFPPLRRHRRTCCPPLSIDSRSPCSPLPLPLSILHAAAYTAHRHTQRRCFHALPSSSLPLLSINPILSYLFILTYSHTRRA